MPPTDPIEIFVSYSRKDEGLLNKLLEHFAGLERIAMIKIWTDREIRAGEEWENKIGEHLNTSKIILLLISPSFIKSPYCYDLEVRYAMERHANQEACVIPVVLRPCSWKDTPFEKLQVLPVNAKPVTKWANKDDAFLNIVEGVRRVVEGIRQNGKVIPLRTSEDQVLPKVQNLLPHLCDRDPQITKLKTVLNEQKAEMEQKGRPPRPVVCLIHGDTEEDPEWFEVRLREKSLPTYFRLDRRQKSVADFPLVLKPDDAGRADILDILHHGLVVMLNNKGVIQSPMATKEEVFEALTALRMPVMIRSHINAEGWNRTGLKLTNAFLEFCNTWPAFPPGLTLICCLVIKYGKLENVGRYKRWKYERANNKARKFLEEELDTSSYSNIHAVVLPKLSPISLAEVQNWIDDGANFDQVCLKHKQEFCSPPDAMVRLNRFYNQSPARKFDGEVQVIPMNPLAKELSELVQETLSRCNRGLI